MSVLVLVACRVWQNVQWGLLILAICLLVGCTAAAEPHPSVHLEMAGSTSMESLLEELAGAYTHRYDYVSIDIQARGTRLGLDALRDGEVDIALVSRDLAPDEQEGLEAVVIAYDAIAILVSDQNLVDSLTSDQLRDIFNGRILLWSEVGGEEADIQVLSREDGSGTRDAFEAAITGGDLVTSMAIVVPGSGAVGKLVAENPLAIGYSSSSGVPLGARALPLDGVAPGLEAVAQDRYPLIRRFILATQKNADEEVEAFVDFVLGPAGQVIVGKRFGRAR
ncbi:MAG TPA: phosphate ABC transporter substrate-binding protein [Anaerolineae bacterium]|nr:phosphate ABC transporter substrate-binding protein [Anaerolineae bacterium]